MPNLRLLERIRFAEEMPEKRGVVEFQTVLNSVINHLKVLLNTRQGSALIANDYGMPDYSDIFGDFTSERVRDLGRQIQQVIKRYEPRLEDVVVVSDMETVVGAQLHFRIQARLLDNTGRLVSLRLRSSLDPEGKVSVRR